MPVSRKKRQSCYLPRQRASDRSFLNDNSTVNLRMDVNLNSIDFLKNPLTTRVASFAKFWMTEMYQTEWIKMIFRRPRCRNTRFLKRKNQWSVSICWFNDKHPAVAPNSFGTAPTFDSSYETEAEPAYYYKGDDTQVTHGSARM